MFVTSELGVTRRISEKFHPSLLFVGSRVKCGAGLNEAPPAFQMGRTHSRQKK